MKFRKKPVVVEAVQFTGHNDAEIKVFCPIIKDPISLSPRLMIPTMEGDMLVSVGDWVIRGVKGEFYPCKPDIFAASYDKLEDDICSKCGLPIFSFTKNNQRNFLKLFRQVSESKENPDEFCTGTDSPPCLRRQIAQKDQRIAELEVYER